jgi:hypothetical protein
MRALILCPLLNENNTKIFKVTIYQKEPSKLANLLYFHNIKRFSVLKELSNESVTCIAFYKNNDISEYYMCLNKKNYEDNIVEQCYLQGKILKKTKENIFVPIELICLDILAYYEFGKLIPQELRNI